MLLFLKTLKTSIVIIFSFITFWITLTSCESYCDDKVGICINTNKVNVQGWDVAAQECIKDGSTLLEIHDENYKEVIITAIQKFGMEGWWFLFGLEYYNGQFHWRSNREVKVQLKGMDGFQSNSNCNFFVIVNGSQLRVGPFCRGINENPNNSFLCLKEKYYQSSTTSTIPQKIPTNITTPNVFQTISSNHNNNQSPDNNYDQLNAIQKRNIGIGVGVTLSLILIIIVVVVVLWICFFRKRKHEDNNSESHESKDIQKIKQTNKPTSANKESSMNRRIDGMKNVTDKSIYDLSITEDEKVYTDLVNYENQDNHHYMSLNVQ